MARIVRFHRLGGPEVLEIEHGDVREPQVGEVRVAVRAFGLNRAESLFRRGVYIEEPELPSGTGLEAAGVIEALGADVTGLKIGDRVALIPPMSMRQNPVHAELVNFPAEFVVPIPLRQTFEEAAATWMAYLTAYGILVDVAELRPGEHAVITAASSSVGIAAIQIVNAKGGIAIAVTRSERKRAELLAAGASHVVASENQRVANDIREVSGYGGPRVVLDAVGGTLLPELVATAATGGIVVSYGAQDTRTSDLPPAALLAKSLTLRGYLVHELVRDGQRLAEAKEFILKHLESGAMRPVISGTFPLDDIREAYAFLERGDQVGKVVVTLEEGPSGLPKAKPYNRVPGRRELTGGTASALATIELRSRPSAYGPRAALPGAFFFSANLGRGEEPWDTRDLTPQCRSGQRGMPARMSERSAR